MVYSTRRFVLCLTLFYFVLVFFSPLSIAITSLGEERANLSGFRTRGLGKEAVETLQSAEETLPKNIESIELKDFSGATNDVIVTTGDVESALKSIEDPQMDVAWVTQATRDLAGVREAMTNKR